MLQQLFDCLEQRRRLQCAALSDNGKQSILACKAAKRQIAQISEGGVFGPCDVGKATVQFGFVILSRQIDGLAMPHR